LGLELSYHKSFGARYERSRSDSRGDVVNLTLRCTIHAVGLGGDAFSP